MIIDWLTHPIPYWQGLLMMFIGIVMNTWINYRRQAALRHDLSKSMANHVADINGSVDDGETNAKG